MSGQQQSTAAAIEIGAVHAADILCRRRIARESRAAALSAHEDMTEMRVQVESVGGPVTERVRRTAGFLVAAGDSWFDYPSTTSCNC